MFVEKRRVAVRVSQISQDPLDGHMCLAGSIGGSGGAETLLGLLNSPLRVIPFIVEGDGNVILLTRLNVEWVMAGDRVEPEMIYPSGYSVGREEPVEIQFLNGASIDGLIQMEVTEHRSRTSDFLNGDDDFYPVLTRVGTLLVNKSRVRETRLATISPRWARDPAAA